MKNFALLCLGVALLAACRKDDIIVCEPAGLMAELAQAAPPTQTFTLNLGQAQSIRTTGGATLSFPPNAFRLPDGQTLATGQAQLRVREIYNVADMVLANMPTTANNGELLISAGEFSIQVWQGSTRLRLVMPVATAVAPSLTLSSPQPTVGLDTTRMRLWKLPANAFAPTAPDSSGWVLSWGGAPPFGPTPVIPTSGYYNTSVALDSISWWNLDQFWHAYRDQGSARATVVVPAGATATRVYFRPVGYNGLARCVAESSPDHWACNLPIGADVIAVVLQEREGQLYFGTQQVITQPNLVVTPTLQALSTAEIVRRIRLL
jgi:hypothetical protein